ncbi:hypothetical protein DL89DRAFT_48625 [Linderina pennispora]|uniref:Uncharacterized protein n=1 Tax=Linderina pennispora TaxID=61395 RepID=A0A1Y1W313_9FUNG|nr:uncharacterized protein DL89DRAFT_48625 [Linderina pennispora]ORX67666.1 hypothetical protein DL89DRAFT_48625 [Linderina pennispora]
MHINRLPCEIFLRAVDIAVNGDQPAPANNYGLDCAVNIAGVCRLWKALLPKRLTDTATIERAKIGECERGGRHRILWKSNLNTFILLERTEDVRNLVVILDDKCCCSPHIFEMLELFHFSRFVWGGIRSLKFVGLGVFCYAPGQQDPDAGAKAKASADLLIQRFPRLNSLSYNISCNDSLAWTLDHRGYLPLNPLFKTVHDALLGKLTFIMGAYPAVLPPALTFEVPLTSLLIRDDYLRTLPYIPRFPTVALRKLWMLCSADGFPWDMFITMNKNTIDFPQLHFLYICFGHTPQSSSLKMAAHGGLDIRFPKLTRVEISDALRVYHDPLALFHSAPLHTLLLADDLAALQRVNTGFLRNIRQLVFAAMSGADSATKLPREAIARFYTAKSGVEIAYMMGNLLPPPKEIAWAALGRLVLNLVPSELHRVGRVIAQLPCLWHLRILHSSFVQSGKVPYTWEEENDHISAIDIHSVQESDSQALDNGTLAPLVLVGMQARVLPCACKDGLPPLSTRLQILEIATRSQQAPETICDLMRQLPSLEKLVVSDVYVSTVSSIADSEGHSVSVVGWSSYKGSVVVSLV